MSHHHQNELEENEEEEECENDEDMRSRTSSSRSSHQSISHNHHNHHHQHSLSQSISKSNSLLLAAAFAAQNKLLNPNASNANQLALESHLRSLQHQTGNQTINNSVRTFNHHLHGNHHGQHLQRLNHHHNYDQFIGPPNSIGGANSNYARRKKSKDSIIGGNIVASNCSSTSSMVNSF
jgi:hypothetical protein